jgi:urocanate hydratase
MLVLDGKEETDRRIKSMIGWDVNNGTARRAWSGNQCADFVIKVNFKELSLLFFSLGILI